MERKNTALVYELIDIVNRSYAMTNDTRIAKLFLENINDLDRLSLDELAEKGYCSQAALSRFIKRMGYQNYDHFKRAVSVSLYTMADIMSLDRKVKAMDTKQIKNFVYHELIECLNNIDGLNENGLEKLVDEMFLYEQVVFVGSDLSVAIVYLLQLALVTRGVETYCLHDKFFQNEFLKDVRKKTLVIAITIEDRWLEMNDFLKTIEEIRNDGYCECMLWTINKNTNFDKYFDEIIYYGKPVEHNFGYNELMAFVMILYQLILKKNV